MSSIKRYPGIGGPQSSRRGVYLGTRGSDLAQIQANECRDLLMARHPALQVDIRIVKTTGDRIQDRPLYEVGGKALFVKELDQALAQNQIQIAVHSMKDLPDERPPGLLTAAITERADPRDALVCREKTTLAELPAGAKVGTSSLRRKAQLLAIRQDLEIVPIRGNVDTRLQKLDAGEVDALLMACAGLDRLKLGYRISERLDIERFLPAAGQGALGVVVRERDFSHKALAMGLSHVATAMAVDSERSLLHTLGCDCHSPVAAHAVVQNGALHLEAEVLSLDGTKRVRMSKDGFGSVADSVGEELGRDMLEAGAHELIEQAKRDLGGD